MSVKIFEWKTIVSEASRLWIKKLLYDGELTVFCGAIFDQNEKEIKISFGERPIYRDIQEEFLTPLWKIKDSLPQKIGWTFFLEQSKWLEELNKDDFFAALRKGSRHYVLTTDDDVIEVVTDFEPIFTVVS